MANLYNPPAAASGFTTQTDQTGSRAINGTVYHNTTTKPILCAVSFALHLNDILSFYSDINASPSQIIASDQNVNVASIITTTTFLVLPGNYYKAVTAAGSPNLGQWIEYT